METRQKNMNGKEVTVEGMMVFGWLKTGLRTLDFECCEDMEAEAFKGDFRVQGMRDGNVYMTQRPKRVRSNAMLISKTAHGRLSGTRDKAYQLTLKVFATEGIDWQKTFVTEPIEAMADLMGRERMCEILTNMLNKLNVEEYGG